MIHTNPVSMQRLDSVGMGLSALCLVHCLILPVAAALLPLAAGALALPEWFHLMLVSLALPVAASALLQGWHQHRQLGALMTGAAGLTLLLLGLAFHEGVIVLADPALGDRISSSAGATLLAWAHWYNWRLRRG